MTKKTTISIFAAMILCSTTIFAQDQIMLGINNALSQGNCEKAQKLYNAHKQSGGKADASIEKRIDECKDSKKVTPPQLEKKPVTPPKSTKSASFDTKISDDINGVVINGVRWATRNVGEKGTFVSSPEQYGKYYTWEEAQRACPQGWRLPTVAELKKLRDGSTWTTLNGMNGRKFGNMFLPAAGYRYGSGGVLFNFGSDGCYYSSTQDNANNVFFLIFSSGLFYTDARWHDFGGNVRCVAE